MVRLLGILLCMVRAYPASAGDPEVIIRTSTVQT